MEYSILKSLKELIYCTYDSNGNKRVKVIGNIGNRKLDKDRMSLLYKIVGLVNTYGIVSEPTRMYVNNRDITIKSVWEYYRDNVDENISFNTIASKIMYDKRKLEGSLGEACISNIVYTSKSYEVYKDAVERMIAKNAGASKLRNGTILKLKDGLISTSYDGDFIEDYGMVLSLYSAEKVNKLEEQLNKNKEFIGYFNYLTSDAEIEDEKAIRDRENLKRLFSGVFDSISSNCNSNGEDDIVL